MCQHGEKMKLDFSNSEINFLVNVLESIQLTGTREDLRKLTPVYDELIGKLRKAQRSLPRDQSIPFPPIADK